MDNMKEQKDFSIQLKLREIDRTYEEIDKEEIGRASCRERV